MSLLGAVGLTVPSLSFGLALKKLKVVLVGTGIRGVSFWGKRLVIEYGEVLGFVGLCDINQGRLEFAKQYIRVSCPLYTDFEKMVKDTQPDLVIVTTVDGTHHEFIIKGLQMGVEVLTEKPLTTDETKCQQIIDAEKKSKKNLIVGFNYRSLTTYSPFEGWRIAFNGTDGRLEAWLDIPYHKQVSVDQAKLHAAEMSHQKEEDELFQPVIVHKLWKDFETVNVPVERSGHGGGDQRLHEKIFINPGVPDPYDRAAGLRDGAMSVLIGVAARKSIDTGKPIRIEDLTTLKPTVKRLKS